MNKGICLIKFYDTSLEEELVKENIKDLENTSKAIRVLLKQIQSDEYYDLRDKYSAELVSVRARLNNLRVKLHDIKCDKKYWKVKYDKSKTPVWYNSFEEYHNSLLETPDEQLRGLIVSYKELLWDAYIRGVKDENDSYKNF